MSLPPRQFLNFVVAQHKADLKQFKVIDRTDELVGGYPASTLEDTWVMRGGVQMSALQVAISDGGNVFVFTYAGTDFEKHRSEAEAIIESFRHQGNDPPYLLARPPQHPDEHRPRVAVLLGVD